MTKHRLLKIAASVAMAPFYGVAWCVGIVVYAIVAIIDAMRTGFSDALFGDRHAAD